MKYLVGADVEMESYGTSYYLFAIEDSKEAAIDFMKAYNVKANQFLESNKHCLDEPAALDKKFSDSWKEENFDYEFYNAEHDRTYKKLQNKLEAADIEYADTADGLKVFRFDEKDLNSYITEFTGKTIRLSSYAE